jgi:pre-mRNA 3'-end-processing factor FIP1
MDEEEDDFYDPADSVPAPHAQNNGLNAAPAQPQESEDGDEEEVEVEDDDVRISHLFRAIAD